MIEDAKGTEAGEAAASPDSLKPSKGLKVKVNAAREAVFGDEGVEVKKIVAPAGKNAAGVLTGRTLVGFAEVEMMEMDGKKHWYPVDQLSSENGRQIVEEEIPIEVPEDSGEEEAEEGDGGAAPTDEE
jgi:hypothetical protein